MKRSSFKSAGAALFAVLAVLLFAVAACAPAAPTKSFQTGSPTQTAPAGAPEKASVALDWYPWSNHTGLYLAQEDGHYRAMGLDINLYVPANPEDVLKLVAAGKDTFGISYMADVLLARQEGIPVKSIAAMVQRPLNSLMTLKASGIDRPKKLEGKKVGYPGIPGHEALLATMLEKDGSSLNKVDLVNVGFDLVPALIGKKVDAVMGAYWVHESILAELQGFPVNTMAVNDWGAPLFYELVLVTSDKVAKEQPELVKRFMWATGKGYATAAKDYKRALDLLVKVNPETNRAMEDEGIKLLAPLWTDRVEAFGVQERRRWESMEKWMRSKNLLTRQINLDEAFSTEFVTK